VIETLVSRVGDCLKGRQRDQLVVVGAVVLVAGLVVGALKKVERVRAHHRMRTGCRRWICGMYLRHYL